MSLRFYYYEMALSLAQSSANCLGRTHYVHGNNLSGYTVNETPGTFQCERVVPTNQPMAA
jgi:hypothetical protein